MTSRYSVEVYSANDGVCTVLQWRREAEFKDGVAFLRRLAGKPVVPTKRYPDQDFYYLETEDQFVALMKFMRAQEGSGPTSVVVQKFASLPHRVRQANF